MAGFRTGRRVPWGAVAEAGAWWAVSVALQVVFIDTLSWPELALAAAIGAVAAAAARAVRLASGARTGRTAHLVAALLHWPGALLTDTARLAACAVRTLRGHPVRGRFHTVAFRPGTGPAWACGLLSATPGLYVTGSGRGRSARVHALTLTGERTPLETALTGGERR